MENTRPKINHQDGKRQIRISGIFLIVDSVLGIPLYEFYSRLSWSIKEAYSRLSAPSYWEDERFRIKTMKQKYQEAKDLARLLQVPIIHIPAFL